MYHQQQAPSSDIQAAPEAVPSPGACGEDYVHVGLTGGNALCSSQCVVSARGIHLQSSYHRWRRTRRSETSCLLLQAAEAAKLATSAEKAA